MKTKPRVRFVGWALVVVGCIMSFPCVHAQTTPARARKWIAPKGCAFAKKLDLFKPQVNPFIQPRNSEVTKGGLLFRWSESDSLAPLMGKYETSGNRPLEEVRFMLDNAPPGWVLFCPSHFEVAFPYEYRTLPRTLYQQ